MTAHHCVSLSAHLARFVLLTPVISTTTTVYHHYISLQTVTNSNQGIYIAPPNGRPRTHHCSHKSASSLVSKYRLKQECFQFSAKWLCRPQQRQVCRQPFLCMSCGNKESSVKFQLVTAKNEQFKWLIKAYHYIVEEMVNVARTKMDDEQDSHIV